MPIFDQDFEQEQGMPAPARQFKALLVKADGVLISSPEYNSGYSALLKNAIDWASRTESGDEPGLIAFKGKAAALMSVSPGRLGGLRGLMVLRMLLANLGMVVLPRQVVVPAAMDVFDRGGTLTDEKQRRNVFSLGVDLVELSAKIKAPQT